MSCSQRLAIYLLLSLASLVVDEVDHDGDGCQDAEADSQRYSGVHPDVNTLLRVNTYTQNARVEYVTFIIVTTVFFLVTLCRYFRRRRRSVPKCGSVRRGANDLVVECCFRFCTDQRRLKMMLLSAV